MALYQWPSLLPLPAYNLSGGVSNNRLVTPMSSGRIRQRNRATSPRRIKQVTFELQGRSQYALFVAVWNENLNNGLDWFEMNYPNADGQSLTLTECRFVSDYSESLVPHENWDISVEMEVVEKPLNAAELAALLDGEELVTNAADPTPTVDWEVECP